MDASIPRRGGTDRPNTDLASAVDQALAIAIEQDARAAALFLEAQGARFALTCRVLAESARRRAAPLDLSPATS